MNKKVVSIIVIIFVAGIAGYFFLHEKSATTSKNIKEGDATSSVTNNTTDSPCKDLGLPEGSYTFEYGSCSPTEKHQMLVDRLSREEYDAGDEHQLAFIKNVYKKSGEIYIDADYFQWLTHSDGSCIIPSETSQPAPGSQTKPECNPNGFLIVNDNPKIRTFKLSPDVRVRLFEEFGNIPDLHVLSPQEFMDGHNKFGKKFYVYAGENYENPYYLPFQLILKNGEIKFIHQVYTP